MTDQTYIANRCASCNGTGTVSIYLTNPPTACKCEICGGTGSVTGAVLMTDHADRQIKPGRGTMCDGVHTHVSYGDNTARPVERAVCTFCGGVDTCVHLDLEDQTLNFCRTCIGHFVGMFQ